MQTLKKQSPNPTHTLQQLLNKHADLNNYFAQHSEPHLYHELAVRLLREAIALHPPKQKHYHVAYVKHNRFLSPFQKQNVTPKVTEIIPLSPEKIVIYGKPKVKLDDQFLQNECQAEHCPTNDCIEETERPQSQTNLDKQHQTLDKLNNQENKSPKHSKQNRAPIERVTEHQIESPTYLSPKSVKSLNQKPQEPKPKKQSHKKESEHRQTGQISRKQDLKIQSHYRTNMRELREEGKITQVQSPKARQTQNYDNVESRIKFLLDRDKKNKQLQKQLQQQSKKIQKLEQRQQKLLMRQYQQSKELNKPQKLHHHQHYQNPCCCSSDQEINEKLIQMRGNLHSQNSYKSLASYHSKVSPLKAYKINTNPIYPITSSDSQQSESDDIVVVGIGNH